MLLLFVVMVYYFIFLIPKVFLSFLDYCSTKPNHFCYTLGLSLRVLTRNTFYGLRLVFTSDGVGVGVVVGVIRELMT